MAVKRKGKRGVVTVKRKVVTIKRNARRKVVATGRNAKRKAVTEGESIPKRGREPVAEAPPMLDEANERARRSEVAHRAAAPNSDEHQAAVERFETARPAAVRKPNKPKNGEEARAWLHAIAEHIRATLVEWGAHKAPGPAVGPLYAQFLLDVRRFRWFADAVKAFLSEENKRSLGLHPKNKKSLGRLLGLERGPGNPGGCRKSGESVERSRKISEQRETRSETRKTRQGEPARTRWKEVGRDNSMSDQAARKRAKRASLVRAEDDVKEFAARLKQRLNQKPPRVGEAKARNEARAKKIRAHNRRKRRSKGHHQSQGRGPTNGPLK